MLLCQDCILAAGAHTLGFVQGLCCYGAAVYVLEDNAYLGRQCLLCLQSSVNQFESNVLFVCHIGCRLQVVCPFRVPRVCYKSRCTYFCTIAAPVCARFNQV
jgi:hypothetical protein